MLGVLLSAEPAVEITPPVLTKFVEAKYPEAAAKAGQSAVVGLSLDIDTEGKVTEVSVVEPAGPEFDQAAVEAAAQFEFTPAKRGEEPIPVRILYRYRFTIELAPQGPVVNFEGLVYDRWSKQPVAGVSVTLKGLGATTTTDERGRFAFADVPAGTHPLFFDKKGWVGVSTEQVIQEGLKVDLKIAMEQALSTEDLGEIDEEVVVRASRIRKEVVETRIEAKEARMVPGTQGDTVKVVETMGGVSRAAAGSGDLVVWGAAPGDTRAYIDSILVPRLFHMGGARSVLASDLVDSVELMPGGYGPDYGRAIGGLLRVQTRRPKEGGVHGFVSLDPIDTSAGVRTQAGERLWLSAGGRKSLLNQTFDVFFDERARQLVPIPDYWDYHTKITYRADDEDTLDAMAFGAADLVRRGLQSDDTSSGFREETRAQFHRVGLFFERVRADGVSVQVVPWFGVDQNRTDLTFGDIPAGADTRTYRGALRLSERRKVFQGATLRSGLDLEAWQSRISRDGSLSLPAREGDVTVFGLPPGDRVNRDEWRVLAGSAAAYTALELRLFDEALSIEPGLRFEPTYLEGDRVIPVRANEPAVGYSRLRYLVAPRLRTSYRVLDWLTVHGAVGRYHQPPDPADLSPIFGSPVLEPAEALHALAGLRADATSYASIELTAFYVRQEKLSVRSPLPTPPLAAALVSTGEGRNVGAQLALRLRFSEDLFSWLTYSISRAERRNGPDEDYRLFDADQTHAVYAVASWRFREDFELGGRLRVTSGFPRTPVVGAYYNARDNTYEPIFGEHNSIRIPAFVELALRAAWNYKPDWGKLQIFLDVQNATNHENAEEIIYSSDFSERRYITGMPILPVLGLSAEL